MIKNRTRPEINQYVACAGDWRASIMMLDISWKGSASEVPRTIAVVSGDPELDSTWKAIAYVSSLCVVGAVGSVRHFRVPCEAHHIPLVHSVLRISPQGQLSRELVPNITDHLRKVWQAKDNPPGIPGDGCLNSLEQQ